MNIGIIGAGATGLAAAYDLSAKGHKVVVYESAPFIGGQASTIPVGGSPLERGYHHLFTNDKAILDLMDELGVGDTMKWYPSRVGTYTSGKVYKTTTALDLLRLGALPILDRIRLGLFALKVKRIKDWRDLEDQTADYWLRERLGGMAYEKVWAPLLKGKFGDYYDQIGMPWFWSKIQTRFASRQGIRGREMLGYPDGSFDTIFDELKNAIESRYGEIHTSTPVVKVDVVDGVAKGLVAKSTSVGEIRKDFDCVLSTVPSFAFPELVELPDDYKKRLTEVHYLAAVVVTLELSQPLTDFYWMNIADSEVPFLGLIEHTNMLPKEWYGSSHVLYLTNYLDRTDPIYNMSQDELLDLYLPHLTKFNPEFDRSWIKEVHYNALSAAQPVIGTKYSGAIADHRTPLKKLYLANTTQIYPEDRGTNYSIQMGRGLAATILGDEQQNWRNWQ
ncbi:MAG: NAD(P)/FAD-dependent oxidoreductase [Dehalococcoidia bacterium]|jgi:protoporphyrinogen oxidase|nr:amine oxidase [Chloroflexota bacterium]MDP6056227.1 NAD(P)/FAD-dependent oxidoreductase [Dehalococcoidia bacterium]MDP7261503.1 NAD(P)/FAD-dependent oxidoreductase [Dehalococcoidia bacterium]MDP7485172.1 NAD(P)/FAD-dependent oxidoreductase [Dehalococcoidia bacterium]|tara:strand:- start:1892 stop:3229 length:1338 start_codon:yes stop_codon:yes gene_type:complete